MKKKLGKLKKLKAEEAHLVFHVITLFPEALSSYLDSSIIARARKEKIISVKTYNPRDFTKDKWRRIDRRPYGGGPGMVIEPEPILKAVEAAKRKAGRGKVKIFFLSPRGKEFNGKMARSLSKGYGHIILISGHYEGVDARVRKILKAEELSVGPYILTGGEVPALAVIDAVSRHVPGVLGNEVSLEEERTASADVYTRPEVLIYKGKKYRVPSVLLTGHHRNIEEWKKGLTKRK